MTPQLFFTSVPSDKGYRVKVPINFTGVVFDPLPDSLEVRATWMVAGQPVGEGFPIIGGDKSIVLEDWLEGDPDGNVLLDGKPYCGYVVRSPGDDPDWLEACYWIWENGAQAEPFECNWHESGAITYSRLGNAAIKRFENGSLRFLSGPNELFRDTAGMLKTIDFGTAAEPGFLRRIPSRVSKIFTIYGNVHDEDLTMLSGLEDIEKLHIDGSQITEKGIQVFRNCKRLTRFTISNNKRFTVDDAKLITDSIDGCELRNTGIDQG